jgi:hypothetical protein
MSRVIRELKKYFVTKFWRLVNVFCMYSAANLSELQIAGFAQQNSRIKLCKELDFSYQDSRAPWDNNKRRLLSFFLSEGVRISVGF